MIFLYTSTLILLGTLKSLVGLRARGLERAFVRAAAAAVDQVEHDAQRRGAVGAIIRQVAKLHHETVGRGGIGESGGVAVNITHHANGGAEGKRGWDHAATIMR